MSLIIPKILEVEKSDSGFPLDKYESKSLMTARKLFDAEFFPQCLLEFWNAAAHNLRRRVEAYGVELFISVVKDEAGRKSYNEKGESLSARWEGVDDQVLIQGAKKLGILKSKAAKALEMINWMRNHASPAHESEEEVNQSEVISLAMLLESALFSQPLPDPGHSVSGLFKPVKDQVLAQSELETFKDQIKSFKQPDVRTCFGFLLDLLCNGQEPGLSNSQELLPEVWNLAGEDLKRVAGFQYHNYELDKSADTSHDKGGKNRVLEFLVVVNGIKYIPEGARSKIYRKLASNLCIAKNRSYGWGDEESVARGIQQFGTFVPSLAFEEFYQELLAVYCGNYWGRSAAHTHLEEFITTLNVEQLRSILRIFQDNARVKEELHQTKPKKYASELIMKIHDLFSLTANKTEAKGILKYVQDL